MEKQDDVIIHPSLLCPRCHKAGLKKEMVMNSLSRCTRGENVKAIYVCNPCGTDEAFEEYHTDQTLTPVSDWPIEKRSNEILLDVIQNQIDIHLAELITK